MNKNKEEYKKNNKTNYMYINRVKTIGIIGIVYGIGITTFDYFTKAQKYNYYLDFAVIIVSIIFLVLSHLTLNKMIANYNLRKYNDNKKKNKKNS